MGTMMEKVQKRKGFTLIELIVVIVILAILAAIAIPAVSKYVGDANDSKVAANIAVVKSAAGAAAAKTADKSGQFVDTEFKKDLADTLAIAEGSITEKGSVYTVALKDQNVTFKVSGTAITDVK